VGRWSGLHTYNDHVTQCGSRYERFCILAPEPSTGQNTGVVPDFVSPDLLLYHSMRLKTGCLMILMDAVGKSANFLGVKFFLIWYM